jgi:hypothetical protein
LSSKQETERLSEYIASDLSPQRSPKGSIFYRRLTTLSSRNHQVTFMSYKKTVQVVKPARKSPRVESRKSRTRTQTHSNTRKNRSGASKRANLLDSNPRNRFEVTYKKVLSIRSKHLRRSLTITEKRSLRLSLAKQTGFNDEIFTTVNEPNATQAQMELIHQQFYYLRESIAELREQLTTGLAFQRCAVSNPHKHREVEETRPFDFVQVYYEGAAASATNFLAQSSQPTTICDECIQRRLEFLDLKLPYLSDHLEKTNATALLGNEDTWCKFTHSMGWRRCNEGKRIGHVKQTILDRQQNETDRLERIAMKKRTEEQKLFDANLATEQAAQQQRQQLETREHERQLTKQKEIEKHNRYIRTYRDKLLATLIHESNSCRVDMWKITIEAADTKEDLDCIYREIIHINPIISTLPTIS